MKKATMSIEDYIASQKPELQVLANKLREVVTRVAPELVEQLYMGYSMISYGHTANMKEQALYIAPQPNHVNLGFYQGTELSDPHKLLVGTGKKLRHVKIKKAEDADRPELHALIRTAADYKPGVE